MPDCIYVAASARDARFTRICVASIRYFYPDATIKLLPGGRLEKGLAEDLARFWNVGFATVEPRDWGWGFVKLEPLFGPLGECFLVLDSDTAFAGPVFDIWTNSAGGFLVDDELQSEENICRLYYDWRLLATFDATARRPQFVFNSGQWFGVAGILTREDFEPFIDWRPARPVLRHANAFMPGEQGVLNYVLNQKASLDRLMVERRTIMHWPGHDMEGFDVASVIAGTAPARIIHWAGMKGTFLGKMPGGDLLQFFEYCYYKRIPFGRARRRLNLLRHLWTRWSFAISRRARLRLAVWFGPKSSGEGPLSKQAIFS